MRGYSLIEMVLAMMIFSLCVGALMHLFGVCLRSTAKSRDYAQAVYLAQGLLEEKLADGVFYEETDSGDFGGENPRHSWSLESEEMEPAGLYRIKVAVMWEEQGVDKSYSLTMLAAERP